MGKLSDDQMENVLDAMFGAAVLDVPATWYVALSLTDPTDDGTGVTEPAAGGYTRAAVPNDATNWPPCPAGSRAKFNGTIVPFPEATADWGDVAFFALYDAATGGTFRGWGRLASTYAIVTGVAPAFAVNALIILGPGT